MNCREFENLISGYMDGELDQQQSQLFSEHIGRCEKCAAALEEFAALDGFLTQSAEPLPDEAYWAGFDARLEEKIQKEQEARKPWWSIIRIFQKPVSWAAVAVLILMAIITPSIREAMMPSGTPQAPSGIVSRETREIEKRKIGTGGPATGEEAANLETRPEKPAEEMADSTASGKTQPIPEELIARQPVSETPAMTGTISPDKRYGDKEHAPGAGVAEKLAERPEHEMKEPSAPAPAAAVRADEGVFPACRDEMKKETLDNEIPVMKSVATDAIVLAHSSRPAGADDYVASSEAVILRIVNLKSDNRELEMLREDLNNSSYVNRLNKNKMQFRNNPEFERHAYAMSVITDRLMNVNPEQIPELQRKVIESGILEKTRELR